MVAYEGAGILEGRLPPLRRPVFGEGPLYEAVKHHREQRHHHAHHQRQPQATAHATFLPFSSVGGGVCKNGPSIAAPHPSLVPCKDADRSAPSDP